MIVVNIISKSSHPCLINIVTIFVPSKHDITFSFPKTKDLKHNTVVEQTLIS